jgi:hypothetical protein
VSATDVALLRPPTGLWGYNMQATDEALERVAESIRERDVRIVALEQLVTDLSRDHAPMQLLASPYAGARHRRAPVEPARTEPVETAHEAATVDSPWAASEVPSPPPATETEPARLPLPFDLPRPSGDFTGPPERSHD